MNTKLPIKPPLKLSCPHCRTSIETRKTSDWFSCPRCGQLVRKQSKKDGTYFLEAGARTETVRPIIFKDSDQKKLPTIIKTKPLNEILELKLKVEEKLSKIRDEKEKVSDQIKVRIKSNQNTEDLRDQLKQLDDDADDLNEVSEQLTSMEAILIDERVDAIKKSDVSSTVFGCSFFIIVIDLLIFAWVASVVWNWKIILSAAVIIVLTSFILSIVSSPNSKKAEE